MSKTFSKFYQNFKTKFLQILLNISVKLTEHNLHDFRFHAELSSFQIRAYRAHRIKNLTGLGFFGTRSNPQSGSRTGGSDPTLY